MAKNLCPTVSVDGAAMLIHGTVPADAALGFGKGCICTNSAAAGTADLIYVNAGTAQSCLFKAVTVAV